MSSTARISTVAAILLDFIWFYVLILSPTTQTHNSGSCVTLRLRKLMCFWTLNTFYISTNCTLQSLDSKAAGWTSTGEKLNLQQNNHLLNDYFHILLLGAGYTGFCTFPLGGEKSTLWCIFKWMISNLGHLCCNYLD